MALGGTCTGTFFFDSAQTLIKNGCPCNAKANCASDVCKDNLCVQDADTNCFPASATVRLESGESIPMSELRTGHKVLAAPGVFSEVYMFSHRLAEAKAEVVVIATPTTTLRLTPNHYLYLNGSLAVAARARAGDTVQDGQGKEVAIVSVAREWADGLYNPHTLHGDIVVDGVRTSTYTQGISPALAHSALFPVRMMYQAGLDIVGGLFDDGFDALVDVLPDGKEVY